MSLYTREGRADVPGGTLWYGICGDLRPDSVPLLAVHGGPGMSHDYLTALADLAPERPVIFYDQLDAGRSDRPNDPANWTVARFLAELAAVRDALDLTRLHLFGNSWGGTIAAAYAATRPAGLQSLTLSSPLIHTDTWLTDAAAYRAALPEDTRETLDRFEAEGRTDAPEYLAAVEMFYARHLCRVAPWPEAVTRTFDLMNAECYAAMWGPNEFTCTGVLRGYDGRAGLGRIAVPTWVTCGAYDEATPHSTRAFAAMIPGAQVEVFADASHMAFLETREAYIGQLRRFLNAA